MRPARVQNFEESSTFNMAGIEEGESRHYNLYVKASYQKKMGKSVLAGM